MGMAVGQNDFLYKLAGGANAFVGGGQRNVEIPENYEKNIFQGGQNGIDEISGGASGVKFGTKDPISSPTGATGRYDQFDTFRKPVHASMVEGYDNQVCKFIDLEG